MIKAAFAVYGCPFTAFAATKDIDALVLPEADSSLFYFKANTNRILNLVGFSAVRDVRLVGCSPEFTKEFSELLAEYPEARFRLSNEPKTCTGFSADLATNSSASDIIVVERQPELVPIAHQLAREAKATVVVVDPVSDDEAAEFSTGLKEFEESDGLARQNDLEACCALIKVKLGADFFASLYSSATFITQFPYNLYPFSYPTGHLPARTAGELVVAGQLKTKIPELQTGVAIVLDSGNTQATIPSEYGALRDLLRTSYGVLPVHKPATLGDFRYLVEDLPADLIFLTAHAGRMTLVELEATFCYKGKAGHVRYAVDRGVCAVPTSGLVDCQTNYVPIEVNGVP